VPVSTTHVITGSIIGVSSSQSVRNVHWKMTSRIVLAWMLTIPAAASVSYGLFMLMG
jgi:inorganic phosphate transporter, PiT family